MKIRLIDEKSKILNESISLTGLDNQFTTETPSWVKKIIERESWQAVAIPINKLQDLLKNKPEILFTEQQDSQTYLVKWYINEQCLNIDLSLMLSQLAYDILLLESDKKDKVNIILE